jgi:hypothetical protein
MGKAGLAKKSISGKFADGAAHMYCPDSAAFRNASDF